MDYFKIYTQSDVLSIVNERAVEKKLGQHVQIYNPSEKEYMAPHLLLSELKNYTAKFVLLGIPEDIGVRANLGIGGAKTAWSNTLKAFLNIQSNSFLQGEEILVLGHFEIEEPQDQSIRGLRKKISEIDRLVYPVIEKIIKAGKIPIIIGGGHNNATPIILGVSNGLDKKLNVVNIDAHADLRTTDEERHSGNGFSYSLLHGNLDQYRVFGLHQNYVHQNLPTYIQTNKNIKAFYFEDLLMSENTIHKNWNEFIEDLPEPAGLEIDLDSIENVLSSAATPSGFTINEIRKILLGNNKMFSYLHICEGATKLNDGREDLTTGKTIAYLISDFIKALLPRIYQQP